MKFHFFLNKRPENLPHQNLGNFPHLAKLFTLLEMFASFNIMQFFQYLSSASLMRCKTKAENKRQIMDKRNNQISPNGLCFIKIRFILFLQTKTAFN